MKKYTSAIIVAAGNSTRMGLPVSKQLVEINGKKAIEYTLSAFENSPVIDEIVVVCRNDDLEEIKKLTAQFRKVSAVTLGGENRTQSVINGVKAASEKSEFFAIHDGARILITEEEIEAVVQRAYKVSCAAIATKVTDTIKTADEKMRIISTLDRNTLYRVQTPQVFEKQIFMAAVKNAVKNNLSFTDDCAMVEAVGAEVELVIGKDTNIKLTTQTDILFTKAILSKRKSI